MQLEQSIVGQVAVVKITGDITTKKIIVETGGEFNGKCQMQSGGIKNAAPASTPQQKACRLFNVRAKIQRKLRSWLIRN